MMMIATVQYCHHGWWLGSIQVLSRNGHRLVFQNAREQGATTTPFHQQMHLVNLHLTSPPEPAG